MPRRRNDPLGVSDSPNFVTDPEREEELLAEFLRRLDYVLNSYRLCKATIADSRRFNSSLARLQKTVSRPKIPGTPESRLDPRIELLITQRARQLAGLSHDEFPTHQHERFVQQAAIEIAKETKPMRGRPASGMLRHHVEGLMALVQQFCGSPVEGRRDKDSEYSPHLPENGGQIIGIFMEIDPDVTETQLVNIIRDARRKYAGKPMRFLDFFPFYGGAVDEESMIPKPGPGYRLQHFELAVPIYCP